MQTFLTHSSKELGELANELKIAQISLYRLLDKIAKSKKEVSIENLEKLYELIDEIKTIQVNIKYIKSDIQKQLVDNKSDKTTYQN